MSFSLTSFKEVSLRQHTDIPESTGRYQWYHEEVWSAGVEGQCAVADNRVTLCGFPNRCQ